jgi:putative copper export protein
MPLDSMTVWLEAAPKALVYVALLLAVGACGVRWFVQPRTLLSERTDDRSERRLARLLLAATALLALGLLLRLLAHTFAAFGAGEWRSLESLRVIAVESRWGTAWRLQMLCAIVALAAALVVPAHRYIGWPAATVAIAACCLAAPLLGHAAGAATRVAFHAIHLLGAGLWLGSLATIVLLGGPRGPLLRRFTPLALAGAAMVVMAGLVAAVEYVGQVSNLWGTAYGRALLLKLAGFSGVLACGYLNWRRWGRGSPAAVDVARDRADRLAIVESALALAVVLVTAVLTELEQP